MFYAELTVELARDVLAAGGYRVAAEGLSVEPRDQRWLARLPDGNMAWFARTSGGERFLQIERRVLRLLASRCTFRAPRVVFEAQAASFDVRVPVPGGAGPWQIYERVRDDPSAAERLGSALGTLLAEQHTRIGASDVLNWLPRQVSWPLARSWIEQRLPKVIDDQQLQRELVTTFARYEAAPVPETDRVLVHADLGPHNLAVDPSSFALRGVFDYEGAAWGDRHHDFRYLVFDFEDLTMLNAAIASYRAGGGPAIDRERVLLYNAACAICYLAFRDGAAPEERPAGRTLAEDLRWVQLAIARVSA